MTTADESAFADTFDEEPPVPIEAAGQVAHCATDADAIPEGLFPDDHVAEVGDYTVLRAGVECPGCGSNVFYHPESIVPHNTVQCFNCSFSPFGYAWWEDRSLADFTGGSE